VVVRWLSHKGADIASAATTDLGAIDGLMHDITGAATVTGLGTIRSGIWKVLKFEGAAILTHNATSLILPGAQNIVTADGDVGIFMSEGSGNWRCLHYMKAAGGVLGPVLGTEQATTSGTTVDFLIPSWAKRITVTFEGVSTNGTSSLLIQLGDDAVETTGYTSRASNIGAGTATSTAGFILTPNQAAADVCDGAVTLTLKDSANFTWISSGILSQGTTATTCISSGAKSLSAALTTVRITSVSADTFDAGSVNVLYD
jgi:hypothetical protein